MLHCDLSIIVRGSQTFLTRCLSGFGIAASEQMLLMYLFGHPETNQEMIAEYFMLDKGSIAKTLQKLEKKELIERMVNSVNQREKMIILTDKAYCVREVCEKLLDLWNQTIFEGCTAEESAAYEKVTARIAENVSKDLEKWGNFSETLKLKK